MTSSFPPSKPCPPTKISRKTIACCYKPPSITQPPREILDYGSLFAASPVAPQTRESTNQTAQPHPDVEID